MMQHKIFMLHYQLNQNTCCNLKFAISITRPPNGLTNHHRTWSKYSKWAILLVSRFVPGLPPGITLWWCGVNLQRVTPGLPLVSKTGHQRDRKTERHWTSKVHDADYRKNNTTNTTNEPNYFKNKIRHQCLNIEMCIRK